MTKKTTMLVVGDQDIRKLVGHEKSSKHRKAEKLIQDGVPILKGHSEVRGVLDEARAILEADPYNVGRRYPIKKLVGVEPGEGQWRLRQGRFRFRYDISGQEVWLLYCGLRSERTYR